MSLAANLVMDGQTLFAIDRRTRDGEAGAAAMRDCLSKAEWVRVDGFRVPCSQEALDFIRNAAPEIAARFPEVFR